jgi:hypothetical protein
LDSLNAPEKLRHALGEHFPFELLAVRPWTDHCVVAERYQDHRVFSPGTRLISTGRRADSA